MPEATQQDKPVVTSNDQGATETRLRLWPALVILFLHFAAALGFWLWGSTNIHNAVALGIVPAVAGLLLIIWWLTASRAPWRSRLLGLALFSVALVEIVFAQEFTNYGLMLLGYALPTMTTGIVILLALTYSVRWRFRRIVLALYMVGCAGVFTALRVDSVAGNLAPVVSWRWRPTAQDLSEAFPRSESQGTAVLPPQAGVGDWPGFRGVARDGRLVGVRFSADWSTPPREVWRRKVGPAWSSYAVVGDYLFTQEQRGEDECVTCYRADTGEEVWVNRVEARFEDAMGLGPRATPTFDEGKLYTQGCTGILQCLDASTGSMLWKRSLVTDADVSVPGWGLVSSPLLAGEFVIQFSGGGEGKSVLAYDRASGAEVWRGGHGTSGYSSPHVARIGGVPQVLMVGNWGLQALALETGGLLWDHAWKVSTNPRCTQPLLIGNDLVMLGTTGTMGSRLLRVHKNDAAWEVNEEWETNKFRPYFNDCVLHNGYVYGFHGDRFACIDVKTGQRQWAGKRYDGQVLLITDMDMLLVLSEAGEVALVDATPEGFIERARFKALTGKTWNHPVVAHGKLFVRNAEEAACYEL
ncbi:MAG: PQQ-binding-like beta-propeller repeat protein [bacterium]|nr:PQQ-binding-like beta-propeller repeat protein [bacterium]